MNPFEYSVKQLLIGLSALYVIVAEIANKYFYGHALNMKFIASAD